MSNIFSGNAIWHLVAQSDAMSKLVLLFLLGLSMLSWTIFFYKMMVIRLKNRQLRELRAKIQLITTVDQLVALAAHYAGSYQGQFLSQGLAEVKNQLKLIDSSNYLGKTELEAIEQKIYVIIDDMLLKEESLVSVLSVAAAVSPLLGLFGTVWGLVHSFVRISEQQSADIVTVAPGIAEALITTLAGLMVAIPSLILFNYLTMRLRLFESQLNSLGDLFSSRIQIIFIRVKGARVDQDNFDEKTIDVRGAAQKISDL